MSKAILLSPSEFGRQQHHYFESPERQRGMITAEIAKSAEEDGGTISYLCFLCALRGNKNQRQHHSLQLKTLAEASEWGSRGPEKVQKTLR